MCAETNITLNGEALATQWTGIQGTGEGILKAYGNAPISWTVICLWDTADISGDDLLVSQDIIHLLSLRLNGREKYKTTPAFTISYKQFGQPSILRFEPRFHDVPASNAEFPEWRTAAFPFATDTVTLPSIPSATQSSDDHLDVPHASHTIGKQTQKTLGMKVKDSAKNVINQLKDFVNKYCPKKAGQSIKYQHDSDNDMIFDQHQNETRSEDVEQDEMEDSESVITKLEIPSSVNPYSATETRSLHPDPQTSSIVEDSPYQRNVPHTFVLKFVFLFLLIGSLVSWLIIRWRDPRRRAERAARREERHTRRLYKCAARRQKYETMVWNFRMRWGLASPEVLRYDEKQRRIGEQEDVLESVVKDDIQALREAHMVVSSMTNAVASSQVEEGRGGYVYEVDGCGRRRLRSTRSVATLPEYQSDESRPPSYRSRRGSGTDFNSNSSVVSTSPRISRDGTNSDFDEKIEELDLREGRPVDFRPRI